MNNVHIFENVGLKCKTENNKIILLKTLVGYNNFQDSQVGSSVPYLIRNVAQNKYEVGVGELGKDGDFYIVREKVISSSNNGDPVELIGVDSEFYIFANEYNFNTAFNNVILKDDSFDVDNVRAIYIVDTSKGSISATLPPAQDNQSLVVDFKTVNNASGQLVIKCSENYTVHSLPGKDKHITLVCTGSKWVPLQDNQKQQTTFSKFSNPSFSAQADPAGATGSLQYKVDATTFGDTKAFFGPNDTILLGGTGIVDNAHIILPTTGVGANNNVIFNNQHASGDFTVHGSASGIGLSFSHDGGLGLNVPTGHFAPSSGDVIFYGSGDFNDARKNLFFSYDGRLGINIPSGSRPQTVAHFINVSDCSETLRLENKAVCHPANLTLLHNPPLSTIPSNSTIATIAMSSKNSASNEVDYVQLLGRVLDFTNGQTKGEFGLIVNSGNAAIQTIKTNASQTSLNHGTSRLSVSDSSAGIASPEITFSGTSINFVDLASGQSGVVNFGTINTNLITPNTLKLDTLSTNSLLTVNSDKEVVAASTGNAIAIANAPSGRILSTEANGIVTTDISLDDYFRTNRDVIYNSFPKRQAEGCLQQIIFIEPNVLEREFSIGDQIEITDADGTVTYNFVTGISSNNGIITTLNCADLISSSTIPGISVQSITKGFTLTLEKYVDPEITALNDSTFIVLSTQPGQNTIFNGDKANLGFTVYADSLVPALDIRPSGANPARVFTGQYYSYSTQANSAPLTILVDASGRGTSESAYNTANFNNAAIPRWSGFVTDVGVNGRPSAFGTFDQQGNVAEWIAVNTQQHNTSESRYVAGGNFASTLEQMKAVEALSSMSGASGVGIRLASVFNKQDSDYVSGVLGLNFADITNPLNISSATGLQLYNSSTDTFSDLTFSSLGTVTRQYRMGINEITNRQYVEFLNAIGSGNAGDVLNLFDSRMETSVAGGIEKTSSVICAPRNMLHTYSVKTDYDNKPVNFVNYLSAVRFANWINNGAPTGLTVSPDVITESGAYNIALQGGGIYAISKDANAEYYLPDINDWYKAAYFQPGTAVAQSGTSILLNANDVGTLSTKNDIQAAVTIGGNVVVSSGDLNVSGVLAARDLEILNDSGESVIQTANDTEINILGVEQGQNSLRLVNTQNGKLQIGPNPSLTLSGAGALDGSYFTGFSKAKTTIASTGEVKILSQLPVIFSGISTQSLTVNTLSFQDEEGNVRDFFNGPDGGFVYKTGASSSNASDQLKFDAGEIVYTGVEISGLCPLYTDNLNRVRSYKLLKYETDYVELSGMFNPIELQVGPDNTTLSGSFLVHQGSGPMKYVINDFLSAEGLTYQRYAKRLVRVDVFSKKVSFVEPPLEPKIPGIAEGLPQLDDLDSEYSFGDTVAIMHTGNNEIEYVKLAAQARGPFDGPDFLYVGDTPLFGEGAGVEGESTISSFFCPGVKGNGLDGGDDVPEFTGIMYSITRSSTLKNGLGYGLFPQDPPAVSGFNCGNDSYAPIENNESAEFTFRPSSQNVISTRPTISTMFNNVGENIDFAIYGRTKFQYNRYNPNIHDASDEKGGRPSGLIPSFMVDANIGNAASGELPSGVFFIDWADAEKTIPTGFNLDQRGKVLVNTETPFVMSSLSKAISVEPSGFPTLDLVADLTVNGYTYSRGLITDHIYLSGIDPNTYIPGAILTTDVTGRVISLQPELPPSVPGPPTLISGSAGNTSVDLDWFAPVENGGKPILNYIVEYSTNNGVTWTAPIDIINPNTGENITGLTNSLNYIFRVRAVNEIGQGQWSEPSAQFTPSSNFPGVVRELNLSRRDVTDPVTGDVVSNTIEATWAVPVEAGASPIAQYIIRYKPFDGLSWITKEPITATSSSSYTFDLTGLLSGPTYLVKVTAQNSYGEGEPSIEQSVGTDPPPTEPEPPPNPNDFGTIEFSGSCSTQITT